MTPVSMSQKNDFSQQVCDWAYNVQCNPPTTVVSDCASIPVDDDTGYNPLDNAMQSDQSGKGLLLLQLCIMYRDGQEGGP